GADVGDGRRAVARRIARVRGRDGRGVAPPDRSIGFAVSADWEKNGGARARAALQSGESAYMELKHDLPEGMTEWVAKTGKGEITRLERHVARREAWVVDVTAEDGSVLEGFLRLERDRQRRNPWSLAKETKIIEALGKTSVPVPVVYGRSEKLGCTLFERVRGRSDLDRITYGRQQRAVREHFMQVVGDMHTLDLDQLGLDRYMAYKPTTPAEAALGEVNLILRQWRD